MHLLFIDTVTSSRWECRFMHASYILPDSRNASINLTPLLLKLQNVSQQLQWFMEMRVMSTYFSVMLFVLEANKTTFIAHFWSEKFEVFWI